MVVTENLEEIKKSQNNLAPLIFINTFIYTQYTYIYIYIYRFKGLFLWEYTNVLGSLVLGGMGLLMI